MQLSDDPLFLQQIVYAGLEFDRNDAPVMSFLQAEATLGLH